MQIAPRVHLVASGHVGLRITDTYDCNVYLLDGQSEAALIDAGGGREPERIVERIESSGVPLEKLRTLLLTHAHADHAAGAHFWREKFGLKVYVAREAQSWIEEGNEIKTSLDAARAAGIYPPVFPFPACPIDGALDDDDEISVGDITLRVLDTPGHARGHIGFWWQQRNALFSGDLVFPGGKICPQVTWDFSITDYAASLQKLHALHIETLYPGHATWLSRGAHADIAKAHELLSNLRWPPFFP